MMRNRKGRDNLKYSQRREFEKVTKQPIFAEYLPKAGLRALPAGFSSANGWMLVQFVCTTLPTSTASQWVISVNDGTSANQLGMRLLAGGTPSYRYPNLQISFRVGNASLSTCNDDLPTTENSVVTALYVWKEDGSAYSILNGTFEQDNVYADARAWTPTAMRIGQRNGGSDPLTGRVLYAEMGNTYLTLEEAQARIGASVPMMVVSTSGQSNIQNWKDGVETEAPFGHNAFMAALANVTAVNCPAGVRLIHGAEGGSSLFKEIAEGAGNTEYWMESDNAAGPELKQYFASCAMAGKDVDIGLQNNGESESHYIDDLTGNYPWLTRAVYKNRFLSMLLMMKYKYPDLIILIHKIGIRTVFSNPQPGIQIIAEIQQELIDDPKYPWIQFGAETYDLPLAGDGIHKTNAGYTTDGERGALRSAAVKGYPVTGTQGPRLTSASRTTNVIVATITHDGGTDFTPTTAIQGLYYLKADGTNIAVTSAARASATTITVTLASDPAGPGILYSCYNNGAGITDLTKILHDNHAKAYPLQRGFVSVA